MNLLLRTSRASNKCFFPRFHVRNLANSQWTSYRSFSSYDFLKESLRWSQRLSPVPTLSPGTILIPLKSTSWKSLLKCISSDSVRNWLEQQNGNIISVPQTLFPEFLPYFSLNVTEYSLNKLEYLLLFRQEEDCSPCEDGLLPPCQKWSPLAKWKYDRPICLHRLEEETLEDAVMSYLLSCYSFDRYRSLPIKNDSKLTPAQLHFPYTDICRRKETEALIGAIYWAQDLISTPAMDLTPGALQQAVEQWTATTDTVHAHTVVGSDLCNYNGTLTTNYGCGMIYGVGHAAGRNNPDREPRLIHLQYRPKTSSNSQSLQPIALVGKGVTFDTGGLNLKPGDSMLTMKKDMGGAALALGLLRSLVETDFPKAVDCWIPAVENVIDADSYRPGDVLRCVNGTTTEIGNTDAEGRLILADVLALASATKPSLMIDFATLTGAQRVALGLQIPAIWSNTPYLIPQVLEAAKIERDPIWHMPLWEGYRSRLNSKIADYRNVPSDGGMGGAITAALYLQEFIDKAIPWFHIDFNGLDLTSGFGSAQSLRTIHRYLWCNYRNHKFEHETTKGHE
jgi:leucyl aminopeptidase